AVHLRGLLRGQRTAGQLDHGARAGRNDNGGAVMTAPARAAGLGPTPAGRPVLSLTCSCGQVLEARIESEVLPHVSLAHAEALIAVHEEHVQAGHPRERAKWV